MDFGQNLIIGISGTELTAEEESFIVKNGIGGIVLFARNFESPEQAWELNRQIQRLRLKAPDQAPLFIGVDMEGGRVHRAPKPFTQWPAAAHLGKIDSPSVAFNVALAMGRELQAVGFNLNFAPCVDVLTNNENTVIGDRAFGSEPDIVAKMSSAQVRGFIKAGLLPCAKHFPGHGNTLADSHEELPTETSDLDRLNQIELNPFKKVFKSRIDLVMTSHIRFSAVDELPVTLSKKFLTEILREDCRYRGLVISDDLDMKALTNHYSKSEIPVRALQAGCDVLLYCNEPDSPEIAIEAIHKAVESGEIDRAELEARTRKVIDLKKSKLNQETLPLEDALELIGNGTHRELADAVASGAVSDALLERLG